MARCEDFPCCGHYEHSTGEIWCTEANRTPEEREEYEMELRHARERADLKKRQEQAIEIAKAHEREHDDERCDNGENQMCYECLADANDDDHYDRDDYYDRMDRMEMYR